MSRNLSLRMLYLLTRFPIEYKHQLRSQIQPLGPTPEPLDLESVLILGEGWKISIGRMQIRPSCE
jgi:hypothetical protein